MICLNAIKTIFYMVTKPHLNKRVFYSTPKHSLPSGPAIGSFLYTAGGFKLPFIVVGSLGVCISAGLFFIIPDLKKAKRVRQDDQEGDSLVSNKETKKEKMPLTMRDVVTVCVIYSLFCVHYFGPVF